MDISLPGFHQELKNFAQSILRNDEDADDVVQDVLEKCLVNGHGDLNRAYVFKAVRNTSLNRLRSRSRFAQFKVSLLQYLEVLIASQGNEDRSIMEMVEALPSRYSEVIILRIKSELSHLEIAEVLGIPEGTVKSRINKALSILKSNVKENADDEK